MKGFVRGKTCSEWHILQKWRKYLDINFNNKETAFHWLHNQCHLVNNYSVEMSQVCPTSRFNFSSSARDTFTVPSGVWWTDDSSFTRLVSGAMSILCALEPANQNISTTDALLLVQGKVFMFPLTSHWKCRSTSIYIHTPACMHT